MALGSPWPQWGPSGSPPHPAPGLDYDLFHSTPPHGSVGSRAALTHMPSPATVQNTASPIHPQSPVLIAPKDLPGCRAALTTPPYPQGPAGRAGGGATPSAKLLPPLPLQAGDVGRAQPQGRPKGGPLGPVTPPRPTHWPVLAAGGQAQSLDPGDPAGSSQGHSHHRACPLGPPGYFALGPSQRGGLHSVRGPGSAPMPCAMISVKFCRSDDIVFRISKSSVCSIFYSE